MAVYIIPHTRYTPVIVGVWVGKIDMSLYVFDIKYFTFPIGFKVRFLACHKIQFN